MATSKNHNLAYLDLQYFEIEDLFEMPNYDIVIKMFNKTYKDLKLNILILIDKKELEIINKEEFENFLNNLSNEISDKIKKKIYLDLRTDLMTISKIIF